MKQFFLYQKVSKITSLLTWERLVFLLFLMLVLFMVNAFWFLPTKRELDANALELYSTLASDARNQIEESISGHQHALENLAFAILTNPEQIKEHISRALRENPAIESVAVLNDSGRELFREERTFLVTEADLRMRSQDPAFQHVKEKSRPYLSPVFISEKGEYLITIALPVGLKNELFEEGIAAVSADIRTRFMIEVVSQISVGEMGLIYVVDSSGFLIAHPDLSLVLKRINMLDRDIIAAVLSGQESSTLERGKEYKNFEGENVFAVALPLEIWEGWGVVAEAPSADVFRAQWRMFLVAILTFSIEVLFLVILFAGYVRLSQTTDNLKRSQTDLARSKSSLEIRTRELEDIKTSLEVRVEARTRELSELAASLENKVKQRTKELEAAKASLETRVEARTRELKELAASLEGKVKERTKELEKSRNALVNTLEDVEESRKALINILEDVEEARKEALEEKDKTQAIITNFADGLLLFDNESKLSLINPQAEKIFGLQQEDIAGKTIDDLINFPSIKEIAALLQKEVPLVFRQELELKENLVLEVTTLEVPIGKKEQLGILVILHDITREKMVEKMKTEFVSLVAHQLRTPLSAIKWTLRILLDRELGAITTEQHDFLEKTYQSNERMISLINDLLNVTRIEEGRYIYKPTLTSIEVLVQSVVNSFKEEIGRKAIHFEFKKPEPPLPQVVIDSEKMGLVVENLLDNAVRYTPIGGRVTISLKYAKKEIECSIKDTGIGIPADQQKRIFSKFFRGANVMRLETEGTGLGLFIAKNIVEAHQGRVGFKSEEGKGSTFYFTLPVKQ